MQSKLVIFLENDRARWIHIGGFDEPSIVRTIQLDEVANFPSASEIYILIPAQDVVLMHPQLPKMNRSKMLQALPYALEDQLVDDLSALHFATGTYQSDGSLPVAIVSHANMQEWMSVLQKWQILPDAIMPITFAIAQPTPDIWVADIENMAAVRTGSLMGFACDPQNLPEMLDIALSSAATMPIKVQVNNYSTHSLAGEFDFEIPIEEKMFSPSQWLEAIAKNTGNFPFINLMQGQYAIKKPRLNETKKLWRILGILAAVWVGLLFLYPTISYLILHSKVSSIEEQIDAIYKKNFPMASAIIDPQGRMETKLKDATAQAAKNRFLVLLGYVAKSLTPDTNVKLTRLDFQGNQLTLQVIAMTSDDFTKFTSALTQQGLKVRQQNATIADARINATLIIE